MTNNLPPLFLERIRTIIPKEKNGNVWESFLRPNALSVRINTLKISKENVLKILKEQNISFKEVPWGKEALILEGITAQELGTMDAVTQGFIYRQGLSSMLPVIILDPLPGEYILDMCAAPGGKTSQMAARMNNQGKLVSIEAVRGRYYKLRAVAQLLGVENVSFHLMDARKFRSRGQLFDKILVDAPCSSEGRFKQDEPETFAYWSLRKIKEMARKQKGLLLSASRLLKPGGTLVYSTCTFAPEENEKVVQWLLEKTKDDLQIQETNICGVETYPTVTEWGKKFFCPQISKCSRILPNNIMEGFFVCQFKKNH